MHRINYDTINKLLKNSDAENHCTIMFNIKLLTEYARHVSTMSDRIKELISKNDGMSNYMIKELENQRWKKHDMAISALAELNDIADNMGYDKVYTGSFDRDDRGNIAQAIFEFCKWYFNKY